MPEPGLILWAGNKVALLCWIALTISLFVAPVREWTWRMTSLIVPGLLAVPYSLLIVSGFGEAGGGGFNSIADVRTLFANDSLLTAGWLHYLAFDLFVGSWIARTGIAERVPALLLVLCFGLTFMFGPSGLLLFLALRLALGKRAATAAVAAN